MEVETEFASGYAREKGEIKKKTISLNMAKETVRQMISLIQSNLKYPEEFDVPMPRYLAKKYST